MRARLTYLIAVIVVILLGMSTRIFTEALPAFVADNFGDALWASMIYCGTRMLLAHKKRYWSVGLSLLFCFAIECSQLYQADWINAIRNTAIGGLVLGYGFLYVDLIRYSFGVLCAYLIDRCINHLMDRTT